MTIEALLFLSRGGEKREGADTLAVETLLGLVRGMRREGKRRGGRGANHVLGKGLAKCDLVALLDEVADSVGILVGVTGREPLVRHVEKGEVAAVLDGVGNGPPLLSGWVDASRVVRTCVE